MNKYNRTLRFITDNPGTDKKEISISLRIHTQQLTSVLRRLRDDKLIKTRPSLLDTRKVRYILV